MRGARAAYMWLLSLWADAAQTVVFHRISTNVHKLPHTIALSLSQIRPDLKHPKFKLSFDQLLYLVGKPIQLNH